MALCAVLYVLCNCAISGLNCKSNRHTRCSFALPKSVDARHTRLCITKVIPLLMFVFVSIPELCAVCKDVWKDGKYTVCMHSHPHASMYIHCYMCIHVHYVSYDYMHACMCTCSWKQLPVLKLVVILTRVRYCKYIYIYTCLVIHVCACFCGFPSVVVSVLHMCIKPVLIYMYTHNVYIYSIYMCMQPEHCNEAYKRRGQCMQDVENHIFHNGFLKIYMYNE